MPKGSADEIFKRFEARAQRLDSLIREGQRLYGKNQLTRRSHDALRESALLDLYTSLELFMEELFFCVLLGNSEMAEVGGVVQFESRSQAEEIFLGGRRHQTWLPFGKGVRQLSQRLLSNDGSPFSRLDRHSQELELLEEMRIVRNAIAHRSSSAQRELKPLVENLHRGRKNAAGLLEHSQQGITRQEHYVVGARQVAAALSRTTVAEARQILSPEDPYKVGSNAPAGRYRCDRCPETHRIRAQIAKLPKCRNCARRNVRGGTTWRRIY